MEVQQVLSIFYTNLSSHLKKIVHCNSNRVCSLQVLQEIETQQIQVSSHVNLSTELFIT